MRSVKIQNAHVNEINGTNGCVWINLTRASEKELRRLQVRFDFLDEDIITCLPPIQRPQVIERSAYIFFTLIFPVYDRKTNVIGRTEVDFFIGDNYVVTVHENTLESLRHYFAERKKTQNIGSAGECARDILYALTEGIPPMLVHVGNDIDTIRAALFTSRTQAVIESILRIRTNVSTLRNTLYGHRRIIEKTALLLAHKNHNERASGFEIIAENTKNNWELVGIHHQTISAIHDSYSAYVTARTNEVMKTLTMFAVVIFPLSLIAAIFAIDLPGMPFKEMEYGFWFVTGGMGLFAVCMYLFYKEKRWL